MCSFHADLTPVHKRGQGRDIVTNCGIALVQRAHFGPQARRVKKRNRGFRKTGSCFRPCEPSVQVIGHAELAGNFEPFSRTRYHSEHQTLFRAMSEANGLASRILCVIGALGSSDSSVEKGGELSEIRCPARRITASKPILRPPDPECYNYASRAWRCGISALDARKKSVRAIDPARFALTLWLRRPSSGFELGALDPPKP